MAIKTTSLRDVLKKKLSDEIEAPTIWVDMHGNEHSEFGITILSADSKVIDYYSKSNGTSRFITGVIRQIGSTVVTCGTLVSTICPSGYPYDLSTTFKTARNLKTLVHTFNNADSKDFPLEIPEDLFWNCPKLESLDHVFAGTRITSIPERLFERCSNLKKLPNAFSACSDLVNVPSGLFKNNKNIIDLRFCFSFTRISTIHKDLLKPILNKPGLNPDYLINFTGMLFVTPLSTELEKAPINMKRTVISKIKDKYFPDEIGLDTVCYILSGNQYSPSSLLDDKK